MYHHVLFQYEYRINEIFYNYIINYIINYTSLINMVFIDITNNYTYLI